jgi:hypothetical protein
MLAGNGGCTPVIPALGEAEAGGSQVQSQPGLHRDTYVKRQSKQIKNACFLRKCKKQLRQKYSYSLTCS